MGYRVVIISLAVLLTLCGAAEAKQYAVVVGIDQYESPEITPLRFAVADAQGFADTLQAIGFDRVFVMTAAKPNSDTYPTRTNIIFRLEWLKSHATADDSVVFYFAGHGIDVDKQVFLLTKESDPRSLGTLKQSACRASDVRELLDGMPVRNLLVVYDACRANPRADRGLNDNRLTSGAARDLRITSASVPSTDRVRVTLFACSEGQRSYEWQEKQHGFFTWYLIEGLRGRAAEGGRVTLQGLSQYVTTAVRQASDEAGHQQQPWMEASGTGLTSWVLANGSLTAAPVTPVSPPRATLSGRWSGPWRNSKGYGGNSVIDLQEASDGSISGNWDGTPLLEVRRDGNKVHWLWRWQKLTYTATLTLQPGERSGRVEYTVHDPDGLPHDFTGWHEIRKQ